MGSRVLIVSSLGRSRCSAVTIAFLMHHHKYTLEASGVYSVGFQEVQNSSLCCTKCSLNLVLVGELEFWTESGQFLQFPDFMLR